MKILILGGSTDIGLELAKYFKNMGDMVISTYNNHKIDVDYEMIHLNVKDEDEVREVFRYVNDKYGKIDMIINLFSISHDNLFRDSSKIELMDVLEVNMGGTYLTNKIFNEYNEEGIIVNMASTDGIDTYNKYNTFYACSKAGIINMSKSISMNVKNRVLCICPNWVNSDSTREMDKEYLENELERIGQSRLIELDELSKSIYDIVKSDTTSGSVIRIDIRDDKIWIEEV